MKILEYYGRLPQEVRVFIEYILPSAVLAALIDYLAGLEINDVVVAGIINIVLIFLRQLKPRVERLKN